MFELLRFYCTFCYIELWQWTLFVLLDCVFQTNTEARKEWDTVFHQLREDLKFSSKICCEKKLITEEEKHKYYMSGNGNEPDHGGNVYSKCRGLVKEDNLIIILEYFFSYFSIKTYHHHYQIFYLCAGRGATSTSVGPIQGGSHIISPGVSIMRLIAESIHSVIPLFHLFPCHLEPPRPTISINLYIIGWLYCTVGAFHMFIPAEPLLPSIWGPVPQCQAVQVADLTWWWQCLAAWHCRSVWSLPCHSTAVAKSHWHVALCSTHKSCSRDHMSWKRDGGRENW